MDSLRFISNMITPLSMFMIGIKLANVDFKHLIGNGYCVISSGIKLLLMPLLTVICVAFLPISLAVKYTLFFLLAMPCASSGAMMAVKYQRDGEFASALVLISTVLCSITIPLIYLVAKCLFAL
jgi:predicted permease